MVRPNILVPVDFRPPSLRACDRAVALGRDLQAKVTLLHVTDTPEYTLLPNAFHQLHVAAERMMRDLANVLRRSEVTTETRVVEGTPWRAVLAAIETHTPELVVCGTHNRRGLAYFAMGSVAERIVRTSTAPVLTIPGFAFESR